jgi:hydroxymethylpyrimidine pyrophosphatase-like HAD family hydrolase
MPTTAPPLGLLLDVDGPIASPVTRRVPEAIIRDLAILAAAGVPIAFITGRSMPFLRDHVIAELLEHGLADDARMYGVCEKGAVWFPISSRGLGESETDETVIIPEEVVDDIRRLVARDYADTMFFDETKQAMISIEQRQDVTNDDYRVAQAQFNTAAFALCADHGLGVKYEDQESADAGGSVPYRIEPTIISTDIESVTLDKDRAAERALDFFASNGPLPTLWRSVGDSRADYLMADHMHAAGHDVAHIDVRPSDGMLERPYPVIAMGDLIHDDAGAAFLDYWVDKLGLR